jgi:hypothetical protein
VTRRRRNKKRQNEGDAMRDETREGESESEREKVVLFLEQDRPADRGGRGLYLERAGLLQPGRKGGGPGAAGQNQVTPFLTVRKKKKESWMGWVGWAKMVWDGMASALRWPLGLWSSEFGSDSDADLCLCMRMYSRCFTCLPTCCFRFLSFLFFRENSCRK